MSGGPRRDPPAQDPGPALPHDQPHQRTVHHRQAPAVPSHHLGRIPASRSGHSHHPDCRTLRSLQQLVRPGGHRPLRHRRRPGPTGRGAQPHDPHRRRVRGQRRRRRGRHSSRSGGDVRGSAGPTRRAVQDSDGYHGLGTGRVCLSGGRIAGRHCDQNFRAGAKTGARAVYQKVSGGGHHEAGGAGGDVSARRHPRHRRFYQESRCGSAAALFGVSGNARDGQPFARGGSSRRCVVRRHRSRRRPLLPGRLRPNRPGQRRRLLLPPRRRRLRRR
mmetsp:Transcript_11656/g.25586  ORF Transcript_11656/g.25586 Transcript_11656/m.25586 type:complete len:274 (+) Transcript_11656:1521-2342(+)